MTPTTQMHTELTHDAMSIDALKSICRKGGAGNAGDPYWISRYIYRPISIYVTWAMSRLGVSANVITMISGAALFAAAVLYGLPAQWGWAVGAILVIIYQLLDTVDGELARYEREVLGKSSGMSGLFLDAICHTGMIAVMVAIGLRLFINMEGPWWLLLVIVIMIFPGQIAPWQRYCETVVAYARGRSHGDEATIPTAALRVSSITMGDDGQPVARSWRRFAGGVLQAVGFPGHFITLAICTILDVAAASPATVGGVAIPYLLIWFVLTATVEAATAVRSTIVYARRLRELPTT